MTAPARQPLSLRNEMAPEPTCAAPGCDNPLPSVGRGRPARYCSTTCRVRAHRQRNDHTDPITVEVDHGSATSRGRHPDRAWLIRLRRGDRSVIVTWGLSRRAADRLADEITQLLEPEP